MDTAGIKNIFADQKGWVKVSDEEIVKRNHKSIITTATFAEDAVDEIKSCTGWENIDAEKNDDTHLLDEISYHVLDQGSGKLLNPQQKPLIPTWSNNSERKDTPVIRQ
ncbi:hypothetical protein N9I19_14675 [Peribacillus sp. CSMR9]|nr:hypothetical protein [Peribacillus sp. CSMR9]